MDSTTPAQEGGFIDLNLCAEKMRSAGYWHFEITLRGDGGHEALYQTQEAYQRPAQDSTQEAESELVERLRRAVRENSGWEPSLSVLERAADEAADRITRLEAALREAEPILARYAEFVLTVRADDLELHPYQPAIEQAVDAARTALGGVGQ